MASTNQSPFYIQAEKKFLSAQGNEEKLKWLEEMIRECPKHKSAEAMLANLKTRRKKLLEKIESSKKTSRGSGQKGVKKEELQAVIIGKTNAGKSSLISTLTNVHPQISEIPFTTKTPVIGMMNYNGVNIQLIEVPAIESEYYDKGIVHTADLILILVDNVKQIDEAKKRLENVSAKILIIFNKIDLLNNSDKRKLDARLKSQKLDFVMTSAKTGENLDELRERIFASFDKIRVFTKEPGKIKSENPLILEKGAAVKEVAEKIFRTFSIIKETKIWGPSSKFPGQKVGLNHILKDMDVVEFKTR